jgi:hypothetical protein
LPLESRRVFVALIENYSTLKPLNISPEKLQILSCDTVVTNERYADRGLLDVIYQICILGVTGCDISDMQTGGYWM